MWKLNITVVVLHAFLYIIGKDFMHTYWKLDDNFASSIFLQFVFELCFKKKGLMYKAPANAKCRKSQYMQPYFIKQSEAANQIARSTLMWNQGLPSLGFCIVYS